MNEERKAKLLLVAVVVIWGLNVVMVKFLSGHFTAVMLGAWRIGAAALMLLVVGWRTKSFIRIKAKEWGWIAGIGVFGILLHQTLLGAGVQTTAASTASLILGLNPLVTMVLAYLLFREPLTARKIGGVILGFCGVTLVVFGASWEAAGHIGFGKGEVLVLLSMLCYVISGMFIKKATQTVPVLTVTAYSHIVATVLLSLTAFGTQMASAVPFSLPSDWFVWAVLLFSGWVATALGSIWWNSGIRIIGAGRTAMYINGMPIWSLIFSMIFLGESITWVHVVGFAAVFAAIYLGTAKPKVKAQPQQQQAWQ